MTLEEALFNHLSTSPGLIPLVGSRIYPLKPPPKKKDAKNYPAISYFLVSNAPQRTGGRKYWARPRYQFSVWAESYAEAKAVKDAIKAVLDNYSGMMGGNPGVWVKLAELAGEYDDGDPETALVHIPIDFFIWHIEP